MCSTWKIKLTGLWCLVLWNPHKVRWYSLSIIILLLHKVSELQRICITCPRWHSWGANLKFQECMAAKSILITTIRVEVFLSYSRRPQPLSFSWRQAAARKGVRSWYLLLAGILIPKLLLRLMPTLQGSILTMTPYKVTLSCLCQQHFLICMISDSVHFFVLT